MWSSSATHDDMIAKILYTYATNLAVAAGERPGTIVGYDHNTTRCIDSCTLEWMMSRWYMQRVRSLNELMSRSRVTREVSRLRVVWNNTCREQAWKVDTKWLRQLSVLRVTAGELFQLQVLLVADVDKISDGIDERDLVCNRWGWMKNWIEVNCDDGGRSWGFGASCSQVSLVR